MKRTISLAIFILSVMVSYASTLLTPTQKASILAKFQTEVKYNFVHLDSLKCDWDSLCNSKFETIVNTPDDYSFQLEMDALCAQLHDGHTSFWIDLQNSQPSDEWIRPLPFKTSRIGSGIYVTDVLSSVYANKGVVVGSEIVKIDGKPISEYFATEIAPYLSSSTPQWTEWYGADEFELTKKPGVSPTTVTFKNKDGEIIDVTAGRRIAWDINDKGETLAIQHKILPHNIGLLKIRSFQQGEFVIDSLANSLDSLENTEAMIIDVRNNTGGNSSNGEILLRVICSDTIPSFKWSTPQYNAAFASWRRPNPPYVEETNPIPALGLYNKPIVVLINNGTFSAAEDFVNLFKGAKRGILIGEATGGSTGNPIIVDLGFGAGARICTRNEWLVDGGVFIGKGISPDIEVIQTPDVLYGKDNVLEKAIEYLHTTNR